jgi:radical SAM superfamily enzyme YgiQ (UPF0313 family)
MKSAAGTKPQRWKVNLSATQKIRVNAASLAPRPGPNCETEAAFFPLGCLIAYAKVHRDGILRQTFDFGAVTPTFAGDPSSVLPLLPKEPEIFLLSNYVWNQPVNMNFAREAKRSQPDSLMIAGGPHVPRNQKACEEYFERHPYVDIAVRHEGELPLAEILTEIAESGASPSDLTRVDFSSVEGITFRRGSELIRTQDRARIKDLAIFPSPYTTGEFDHWLEENHYIPIESNRGCPYGCTFCDWGAATLSKVNKLSMERVLAEIEFAAKRRVHTIGFCDANFGILPRDLDIVRHIIQIKERYGYPKEVGYVNAKMASPRLTEVIKLLRSADLTIAGQISMQTTDQEILDNVSRSNIKMSEYRKMIAFFHQEGIPAVSDMMLGLPGQTIEKWQADLQFCFDHKVGAVIFATSVMPNAPMASAEYRKQFQIEIDIDGFVESTYSFTPEQYTKMFDLCLGYKLFIKLGLLKYFLYFAQIEHGLKALDFISKWMKESAAQPDRYPISDRIRANLLDRDYRRGQKDWLVLVWNDEQGSSLFDNLDAFYREMLEFIEREYDIHLEGSDVDAVLTANREIMPKKGRKFPQQVSLGHDVPAYFDSLRGLARVDGPIPEHIPLSQLGPGTLELREQPARNNYTYLDLNLTLGELELASNLSI